ncbi:SBBP repeat-containing protein [Arcticibacterium luteifluviistationis]|uniref:Bulb-type lectin domain-containing protein n=1 Tax=Arcticibacterium luteifluviistationis TaxID=1784714 RepID=A0A2Z4GEU6_9BACT|nr:SBBP repeat-containing protein [Arcticibacterium luteifluviistationis]AWV99555.1 hypothetical protein DJ013_15820 [Arcticibacterium luteifluviistationis]
MKNTLLVILISCTFIHAQNVTITPGGITPGLSGTYQRISYSDILEIASPVEGDQVYDITFHCMRVYNGSRWVCTYQLPKQPVNDAAFIASAGGTSLDFSDSGESVAVDGSGNVYVTGSFGGTANFGGISKTSGGESDVFIAKYNSSGAVQWVQSAGGLLRANGRSISLDASGNIYITGDFRGTATFGGISKTSGGANDIFVAKYNASGVIQWVQSAGGPGNAYGYSLDLDAAGNVYVTGSYYGTATFSGISKTSLSSNDIFVVKYNSGGAVQWVESAGGAFNDIGRSIAVDGSGNIYVTGSYENDLYAGGLYIYTSGGIDVFIAKYDASGNSQWLRTGGGPSFDVGRSVATDTSGNVYITGAYKETATFYTVDMTSVGDGDIFIAKYNSDGILQWAQSAGGTLSDSGLSVAVDLVGNVYVTGYYNGVATFGSSSLMSVGETDVFVVKYNSSGNALWLQCAGGTSYDFGSSVAVDNSGNAYITGSYRSTATFGASSHTSVGSDDVFLGRISQ